MPICSFCKKNYDEYKGLTVFLLDGRALHFCSSKCRRNLDLGRDSRKVNWTRKKKKGEKKEIIEEE